MRVWVGVMARPVGPKISPFSRAGVCARVRAARCRGLSLQDGVDLVPQGLADDRLVLAGIGGALVDGIADVDAVVEELVDEALVDQLAVFAA